jgi:CheY-like chemotaxis protein/HD-like signal output (HDOD) protein
MARELMDCGLRSAGYETACVADGREALAVIKTRLPDLILLDVKMPIMGGLKVLEQLRADPTSAKLPVILLTGSGDKADIVRAAQFGVQDYLLKSHFSLKDLLARVRKHLSAPISLPAMAGTTILNPATPSQQSQRHAPEQAPRRPDGEIVDAPTHTASKPVAGPPRTLNREETIDRVEKYAASKTLAGVVAEVISMAGSPRASMGDLVGLLKRDAVICARVMQVANSSAFTTEKPAVSTIEEAVRNIGLAAVRNIATSVGFFEAFPPDTADGFNAIRCWQHSFAAAAILERIAPPSATFTPGMAYLVGLCHDLGEIVLRQCLSAEYGAAVEQATLTGTPLQQTLLTAFGIPWRQLSELVLKRLGLPVAICAPILEHADISLGGRGASDRSLAAQALALADLYAHGLLLASSPQAMVAPVTLGEVRRLGTSFLPEIDGQSLRCEVLSNTSLLARLSRSDEQRLSEPLFPARPFRVWYARHPGYASFDPLGTVLGFLAQTETYDRLPVSSGELEGYAAMVVVAARPGLAPFQLNSTVGHTSTAGRTIPVLYLTGSHHDGLVASDSRHIEYGTYPLPIARVAMFIEAASERSPNSVAA